MANLRGLLGAIADLPGVINQGLLGPLNVNPQLEQLIGRGQVAAQRSQTANDFAAQLLSAGPGLSGLGQAQQGARQGFSGRIFDLLKEQEAARLMQAQQADMRRQERFAASPVEANLPLDLREKLVAERSLAETAAPDPNIQARFEADLALAQEKGALEMALLRQRAASDAASTKGDDLTVAQQQRAVQALRKEYRGLQSVKDYETVLPLIESAKRAPNTGYGDLQLIYTVGKALDPNSVVREGELHLTLAASDPASRAIGEAQFVLQKGGRLTPKLRKDLVDMLEQRTSAYRQAYERDLGQYSEYAKELKTEPSAIVGSHASSAYIPAAPGLAVGDVRKGYRYKGGDPSKPESWEKQ